ERHHRWAFYRCGGCGRRGRVSTFKSTRCVPDPRPMEAHDNREAQNTARTEAFSDGVFAFAITLLVLNLRDPTTAPDLPLGTSLLDGLIHEWQSFFALVTSFITILVMWLNHHNMFSHIGRVDRRLMLMNGLLLLFVVLTPFTTLIVSGHLSIATDAGTAAAFYSGNFLLSPWRGTSSGGTARRTAGSLPRT